MASPFAVYASARNNPSQFSSAPQTASQERAVSIEIITTSIDRYYDVSPRSTSPIPPSRSTKMCAIAFTCCFLAAAALAGLAAGGVFNR